MNQLKFAHDLARHFGYQLSELRDLEQRQFDPPRFDLKWGRHGTVRSGSFTLDKAESEIRKLAICDGKIDLEHTDLRSDARKAAAA